MLFLRENVLHNGRPVLRIVYVMFASLLLASCATSTTSTKPVKAFEVDFLNSNKPLDTMNIRQIKTVVSRIANTAPKCQQNCDTLGYISCMTQAIECYNEALRVLAGGNSARRQGEYRDWIDDSKATRQMREEAQKNDALQCLLNRALAYKYLALAYESVGDHAGFSQSIERALESVNAMGQYNEKKYSIESRLETCELLFLQDKVADATALLSGAASEFEAYDKAQARETARTTNGNTVTYDLMQPASYEYMVAVWRIVGHTFGIKEARLKYTQLKFEAAYRTGHYQTVCSMAGDVDADADQKGPVTAVTDVVTSALLLPFAVAGGLEKLSGDSSWVITRGKNQYASVAVGLNFLNAPVHLFTGKKDLVPAFAKERFIQSIMPRWYVAMSAYYENQPGTALDYFNQLLAREDCLSRTDPAIWWTSHYFIGAIREDEGKFEEARTHYAKAIDIIENLRNSLLTDQLKLGFTENKNLPYGGAVRTSLALNDTEAAFVYSERARSRALLDLLENRKIGKSVDPPATSAVDPPTVDAAGGMTALPLERLTKSMFETRAILSGTGATPSREAELNSILGAECLTVQDVQGFLGNDDSLVEYFVGDRQLVVFVLNKDSVATETVKTDARVVQEAVEAFRSDILSGSPAFKTSSQRLYKMIYAPVETRVRANVIFVPHLQLHKVPFAALVDGDGRYLVESKVISTVYSGSTLKYLAGKGGKSLNRMLALANPTQSIAPMLPSTEQEVAAIGPLFAESNILVGNRATKAALLSSAKGYDVIHLACHGKFYPENPSQSCLLLAGGNEDSMLRASDIYQTDITGCSLVTLSACETGLSKETTGDDALGLGRALIYAGAPRIVVSLWSVADAATAELMVQFYGSLKKDSTAPQALRTAQLAMLHRTGETAVNRGIAGVKQNSAATAPASATAATIPYGHPFFWAAFVVMGEWR